MFIKKFLQYLKERFPLYQFIPLSLILSTVAVFGGQIYFFGTVLYPNILIAFIALFLFLLRLRLFDEFKDYQHDVKYYPDRPVARGLIKLEELKKIVVIIITIELLVGIYFWPQSFIMFLISFVYSFLMFKEFFVSNWLKKHFTTYILSHEILVIPLFFYLMTLAGISFLDLQNIYLWVLIFFLSSQLFLLEVTRKFRPKELEINSRDTYTAQYGITGASMLATFLSLLVIIMYFFMNNLLLINFKLLGYLVMISFIFFMVLIFYFINKKNEKSAKLVFLGSILLVFLTDIIFIINIL